MGIKKNEAIDIHWLTFVFRWWDLRSMTKTNELAFDEPITSMERSSGSLGELITVTSGKKVYFLDMHK